MTALQKVFELLGDVEIDAIGHRVVHGGEYFKDSVISNSDIKQKIQELCELAPLHNPANLMWIEAVEKLLPHVPNVAVFDTAFHQTMEPHAYIYALPYEFYEKYKIRRYVFHRTSHKYVSQRAARILGKSLEELKIIVCHVWSLASVSAIDGGEVIDTSMGFTPLEWLNVEDIEHILNKKVVFWKFLACLVIWWISKRDILLDQGKKRLLWPFMSAKLWSIFERMLRCLMAVMRWFLLLAHFRILLVLERWS